MASQPTPAPESPPSALQPATTITMDSPLPDPIVTTSRLIIRPLHPKDAESMQRAAAPAVITKYMSLAFGHPYTLEHAKTWINMNLTPPLNNFAIFLSSAPTTLIGCIGLKPGSDVQTHTAEIGYWVGEDDWGKGYTTEALAAMTEWTFTIREGPGGKILSRLWAGVFSGNTGSMRCLEKCGYRAEGVMKGHVEKHGEVYDMHIFGLTRGDWEEWRNKNAK